MAVGKILIDLLHISQFSHFLSEGVFWSDTFHNFQIFDIHLEKSNLN